MNNTIPAKLVETSTDSKSVDSSAGLKEIEIRVSPNNYFIAVFITSFISGLLIYLNFEIPGITLFVSAWVLFAFLAFTDRIIFDGNRLRRTGFIPKLWARINNSKYRLRLKDIEQVETQALRALKRGGNVFYRYRTTVAGRDLKFVFASGGEDYRLMIQHLLSKIPENSLDNRSIELRDYLAEPKETLMKAEFEKIPSAEVLEDSLKAHQTSGRTNGTAARANREVDIEKADYLRRLANELRLSGYLIQSLEAFRRALQITPGNAWLLFEFARCLHSFAGSEHDPRLQKKAFAALRLAERRGAGDSEFLERLGESYFQYGDWDRAQRVFQKALDSAGESFRSVRGMAEIAIREGKIAHVIHHFGSANRLAESRALRRWTQGEGDYFRRLNSDEDYMELEVSRVNMLENLESHRKISLRVAIFSFPLILFGVLTDETLVANVGWALSGVALLIWLGLMLGRNLLSSRIPADLVDED